MKVRCGLCGKIFASEEEFVTGAHDKRVHAAFDPRSRAKFADNWRAAPDQQPPEAD